MSTEDLTDFEDAWKLFEQQQTVTIPDEVMNNIRGIFMAGGYAAIGVLSNRLSALPGTVEPGDMVKALINAIQVAFAELELKANRDMPDKSFGSQQ